MDGIGILEGETWTEVVQGTVRDEQLVSSTDVVQLQLAVYHLFLPLLLAEVSWLKERCQFLPMETVKVVSPVY